MSNEPDDESAADPQQESEQQPADSDQPGAQSNEQLAGQADQSTDTPAEAGDQQQYQPTGQSDQSGEESDQVAVAEGDQTGQADASSPATRDDKDVPGAGEEPGDGNGGSAAEPARGGSLPTTPRKRLFRFVVSVDNTAVPDSIKNVFSPDPTDYFFGYAIAGAADPQPLHMIEDKWERVPVDGIMDFPYSTVERKQFFIGISVVPNSKVDPNAATSQPLHRIGSMHTDDFTPIKAADAPTLVKKFPDGVFILQINLVAFYIQIVDAGSTTFEAELAKAKISLDDVVYNALSPYTDSSGKVIGTKHDVVYWSSDLHLSGRKYVP